MNIKKIFHIAPLALLLSIAMPANSAIVVPGTTPTTENPRAQQLIQRLEEIKEINKSELTSSERKELRKEVRGIKKRNESPQRRSLSVCRSYHHCYLITDIAFVICSFKYSFS